MNYVLIIISCFLIISGILPLIKHDNWTFRVFEYPRAQKLIISIIILALWIAKTGLNPEFSDFFFIAPIFAIAVYLMVKIYPFTSLGKKMIVNSTSDDMESVHLLVLNVYQYNTEYQKTINLIKKVKPDVFFLVETNQEWANSVAIFKNDYPYHIEVPLENTYGLLFYSKFEFSNESINYLIDEEIPSIELDLIVNPKKSIRIYGIHPTPPVPGENPSSTDRDAEILIVGKKAKEQKGPCIVMGDLNDVGWSYSSELFLKISGLLDLRRGRGFFNTFHAKYFFLRWPLDHIFVSEHFTIKDICRHPGVGSDHFPIGTILHLEKNGNNECLDADQEDKNEAEEKIEAAE
ncbi:endonuclease/exonuclease/phosphatase family protein [Belliella sp. DSM 107340]|uniref:Endonuclease/exonuclease/phosphatase family protein n=1 Tax=Belliella calami TaxID=2923436 RepID=A0ABS9UNZ7_9BACT|nr:endonuclease/exonuclease/phosphatase family protein [Belliella calami]MCH7398357.1 endonuclease/exonuclease/phosphatase family protein [Belliella calami]